MEEIYNKWQLQDKDLGNTEPYQFTKSELMDFAKEYHKEQLMLGAVIERFTIDDAKEMVTAWENLEGNRNYTPKDIERWLINDMKPVIDKFRAKIKNVL